MISQYQPRHRYQAFIEAGLDEETAAFYGAARRRPILGTETFRQARLAEQDPSAPELSELRYPDRSPPLEAIIAQVAEDFGVTPDSLLHAQRGRRAPNIARAVAMCLARNPGGHSLIDIAAAFHLAHYTGVAVTIKRLHARLAEDQALAHRIRQLALLTWLRSRWPRHACHFMGLQERPKRGVDMSYACFTHSPLTTRSYRATRDYVQTVKIENYETKRHCFPR